MTSVDAVFPALATEAGARQHAYAALHREGPVQAVASPAGHAWLVTGHDEVRSVLTDPRCSSARGRAPFADELPAAIDAAMNTHMLNADPPDHTRLRRLVSAAFTRRRVEGMAPRIRALADDLLDAAAACGPGPVELVDAFAYPLPITVICELLGVPEGHRTEFRHWSGVLVAGALSGLDAYADASAAMITYLRGLLADKRRSPGDDLLSALVSVRDAGDRLTEDELTSMAFLLLVAGHETTVNLIANGAHALLTHPRQRALLRAEPERWPAAIEELLRFESPLQVAIPRVTTAPVEVGGVVVPADQVVFPGVLAANRDPDRYADPAVLDVTRASPHLAFGHGIHHCLGAPLARLEGRIALRRLVERFGALRLAVGPDEIRWRPGVLMHGVDALPVMLEEGSAVSSEDLLGRGYLLDNAAAETGERFAALSALFDPVTARHVEALGIAAGARCWEVGAGGPSMPRWLADRVGPTGGVLATDLDVSWIGAGMPGVEVRRQDVALDGPPRGGFDLVHARLVLTHVPAREEALRHMVAALRPGGRLLIEDFDVRAQPWACLDPRGPEAHRANRIRAGFVDLLAARGVDLRMGRALPERLRAAGLLDVTADAFFPIAHPATTALEIANVRQVRAGLVEGGYASDEEIEDHLAAVAAGALDVATPPLVSASGRRPPHGTR